MKKLTRQRKWQLKKLAEGKCEICGKAPLLTKYRCAIHVIRVKSKTVVRVEKPRRVKILTLGVCKACGCLTTGEFKSLDGGDGYCFSCKSNMLIKEASRSVYGR